MKSSYAGLTCSAGDHAGLAAAVLCLSEMSAQERGVMGENGLNLSIREFDRDTLIDRLEKWMGQLKMDGISHSIPRGKP